MGRVYIIQAFLVIFPPNGIDVFIHRFTLNRENWHPIFQLLSISGIVLRETHIDVTGDSMPIHSDPFHSISIVEPVDHLLFNTILLRSLTSITRCHSWIQRLLQSLLYFSLFAGVEIFYFGLFLVLLFLFVLILSLSNLITMGFFKLQILSHNFIHVWLINIYIYNLFAFLDMFVFIFQTKPLSKLFLEQHPSFFFVQLGSLSEI